MIFEMILREFLREVLRDASRYYIKKTKRILGEKNVEIIYTILLLVLIFIMGKNFYW